MVYVIEQIGDVGPGQYNITAQGSGGIDFFNSTALQYVHKSYSVFIQTDKAIYKPGHKVQFRAVVLNSHLKPGVTAPLDIHITVSLFVNINEVEQCNVKTPLFWINNCILNYDIFQA